jgi:Lipocalin-like domain
MRHVPAASLGIALLAVLAGAPRTAHAQGMSELAGGWIVASWTSPQGKVNSSPQRGLFIFTTTGQYSMMFVNTDEPRPRYTGETQTDAEMLGAYKSLTANSGRYTVKGKVLTYEAFVAKDPNYMANWNAATPGNAVNATFSITNGILTLKWLDGNGGLAGSTATLRRPTGPG